MNNRTVICILCLTSASTVFGAGYWTVTTLHPEGAQYSYPTAAFGNVQGGFITIGDYDHASFWSGTSASCVDLHPNSAIDSVVTAVSSSAQAGNVNIGANRRAAIWTGTAASWVDLHPVNASNSSVISISEENQVGFATIFGSSKASIWTGSSASWVDLTPPGASESIARLTIGSAQGGYATIGGVRRAGTWSGSANSWVELHPIGASESNLAAIESGVQGGYFRIAGKSNACLWRNTRESMVNLAPANTGDSHVDDLTAETQVGAVAVPVVWIDGLTYYNSHASLWNGTAESWVDLHPVGGPLHSRALMASGNHQAGWVVGGIFKAAYWNGTPESYVDLSTILPPGFSPDECEPTGIWSDEDTVRIVGWARDAITNRQRAVVWTKIYRTISGQISTNGGQTFPSVSVQLRRAGTTTDIGSPMTVAVDPNGNYEFYVPSPSNFDMMIMPRGYLRRTINANASSSNVVDANMELVPGNIFADNVIDLSDYSQVATHFNKLSSDPSWNVPNLLGIRPSDSDINGDGVVDLTDYTFVATNFNKLGDD